MPCKTFWERETTLVALGEYMRTTFLVGLLAALSLSCAAQMPAQPQAPTASDELVRCWEGKPRDEFESCVRRIAATLEPLDSTRRSTFGELYDPAEWTKCVLRAGTRRFPQDTACDVYRLRRVENPERWPTGTPAVQWPTLPPSVYRPGMSSKTYFDALCAEEAGEFIYRTVSDVTAIFDARPRLTESDVAMRDRFVVEDPFGYVVIGDEKNLHTTYVQPPNGPYRVYERADASRPGYEKFFRGDSTGREHFYMEAGPGGLSIGRTVPYIVHRELTSVPTARYGMTWRGIDRAIDRQLGIAGGELAIVDMQSGEVLALRRNFARSGQVRGVEFWWLTANSCVQQGVELDGMTYKKSTRKFVESVLLPAAN